MSFFLFFIYKPDISNNCLVPRLDFHFFYYHSQLIEDNIFVLTLKNQNRYSVNLYGCRNRYTASACPIVY